MSTPIQFINLTVRSENCLLADGVNTVEDLISLIKFSGLNGLLKKPNLGRLGQIDVAERLILWLTAGKETSPQNSQDAGSNENEALRDDFAAKAMQELIHSVRTTSADEGALDAAIKKMAGRAYQVADAMLRAREAK